MTCSINFCSHFPTTQIIITLFLSFSYDALQSCYIEEMNIIQTMFCLVVIYGTVKLKLRWVGHELQAHNILYIRTYSK